jgi:hypothetical protein
VPPLHPENDVTAYIVVEDFGGLGRAFLEMDLAGADHETIVRNMISGEYGDPLRIISSRTPPRRCWCGKCWAPSLSSKRLLWWRS